MPRSAGRCVRREVRRPSWSTPTRMQGGLFRMEQPVYHRLSAGYSIGPVTPADKPAYIEHFKDRRIYENTANIPYPYTEADADWWIAHRASRSANSKETLFAIRNPDGLLVGSVDA